MPASPRGRYGELAALRAAFDSAPTRGRLAVVRGEPGSGKTELLRQAAQMWRKEGVPVVSAQPRGRCVVFFDDADEVKEPAFTALQLRAPGCLVVATCHDDAQLVDVADLVIDLPPLADDVVVGMLAAREPLDDSVINALRTALGPLFGNPGTVLATLYSLKLTSMGDRLFLTDDKIALPPSHPLLDHVHGLAQRVALLAAVRQGIEIADLALLNEDMAAAGRALDSLVEHGVLTPDLKIRCPALSHAILARDHADEVRQMHVSLAKNSTDPELVALAGPDLPDAHRRSRWLAGQAAAIEATDPERAGRWYVAATRMAGPGHHADLVPAALATLVRTGQDDLIQTLLSERDANTDAAAMLLLFNGKEVEAQGPAAELARWWLGERPEWTPLPMDAADQAIITGAELNAIHHALKMDAHACRTALRYVRNEQARDYFDDIIEAGAAGDVATLLEHVLGERYRTPQHGPLQTYQRVVQGYAEADWTAALSAVRQLELVSRPMPAHQFARMFAASIHAARGEQRHAATWLARISREPRYLAVRTVVECNLLHKTGDSHAAVNLAWRTLARLKHAGIRPGVGRLLLQALQISLRNNDVDIARRLMAEIEELHQQDDCRCTLQILFLARGLLHGDPAEAARGADIVRQRGHRPDLMWACHILAQFCDDPKHVVRELHAIAKQGGSSFLLPARVSALMRKFGVTAPRGTTAHSEWSETELRIVELVRAGQTNRQIATELEIREKAVEHHLTRLFLRTGVRSRVELAAASLAGRFDRGAAG